ncbi:MAG: DUF934 domain-containing protein [Azonexus sp.]|jgi:uncharacterized protein (DUF934 family)|nr:DUF934 domain-containing protein [Azonexus sp.]
MAQLIKDREVHVDTWQALDLTEDDHAETVTLPLGETIFPLAVWRSRQAEIIARGERIGLLLQADDTVEEIAADLPRFALVAVNFPRFVDGRGYSTASLLRQRYGYRGELRAVGDVLHDQLFYLARVGFDSYALKNGKNAAHALTAGFSTFRDSYQAASDQPQPWFRRRA